MGVGFEARRFAECVVWFRSRYWIKDCFEYIGDFVF